MSTNQNPIAGRSAIIGDSTNLSQIPNRTLAATAVQVISATSSATATLTTALPGNKSIDHWIDIIHGSLGNSAAWLVITGQKLIQAKNQLGHGNWLRMFESGKLKLTVCSAQMLMKVAQNAAFLNQQNFAYLPPSTPALY